MCCIDCHNADCCGIIFNLETKRCSNRCIPLIRHIIPAGSECSDCRDWRLVMENERDELMIAHGLGEFVGRRKNPAVQDEADNGVADMLTMRGLGRLSDDHNSDSDSDLHEDGDTSQSRSIPRKGSRKSSLKRSQNSPRQPSPDSIPVVRPSPGRRLTLVERKEEICLPAVAALIPARKELQRPSPDVSSTMRSNEKRVVVVQPKAKRNTNMDAILAAIAAQVELERQEVREDSDAELESKYDDYRGDPVDRVSTVNVVEYQKAIPTMKTIKSTTTLTDLVQDQPEVVRKGTCESLKVDSDGFHGDYYRDSIGEVSTVEVVGYQRAALTVKIVKSVRKLM